MQLYQMEEIDSTSAKATMTYENITASGIFHFNSKGDIVSFEAKRYYDNEKDTTLENWFIEGDANGYKEFEGIRILSKGKVTWKLKSGDFAWLKLEIIDLTYNKLSE